MRIWKRILSAMLLTMLLSCAVAFAATSIDVKNAWYKQEESLFGAQASINGGEYFDVAYKLGNYAEIKPGLSAYHVYQRKNNSDWVYWGYFTKDKGNWIHNVSEKSLTLFLKVANAAAQSKGYDKMF